MDQKQLYTIDEAAAVLRIGRTTLFKCMRQGRIKRLRVGPRKVFIPVEEVNRFIASTI